MVTNERPRPTLRANRQFRAVYDGGEKVVGRHSVVFYYGPEAPNIGPVFGYVASKRVGDAVRRNRAKRLLREAARRASGLLNDRNIWIVLVAKSSIIDQDATSVSDDLTQSLRRAGLLSG